MSRRSKKSKQPQKQQQQQARPRSPREMWHAWYASKAPVFQFGLKFCALILLFYLLSPLPVCKRTVAASSVANARISSALLHVIRERTDASGTVISSPKYALTVLPTCSAFEYVWFFCAMVIAFPARLQRKFLGIPAGIVLLFGVNVIRITSLFWIGEHYPRFFDVTHEQFWSLILIVAEIALCATWISWARPQANPEPDVAEA